MKKIGYITEDIPKKDRRSIAGGIIEKIQMETRWNSVFPTRFEIVLLVKRGEDRIVADILNEVSENRLKLGLVIIE